MSQHHITPNPEIVPICASQIIPILCNSCLHVPSSGVAMASCDAALNTGNMAGLKVSVVNVNHISKIQYNKRELKLFH